jgi:leucyl aminopeptidase
MNTIFKICKSKLKQDNTTLHVFFSFNSKYIKDAMSNVNLSNYNVGNKISVDNYKLIFFELDESKLFLTALKMAESIAKYTEKNICIYTSSINNKYKLLILQLIAKLSYQFTKYKTIQEQRTFYIKDSPKNFKFIEDIISQINNTNINRDFQNEPSNIIYPETFINYANKLLPKHKSLNIITYDEHALKSQGFNLISSIGSSSNKKPRLMIINYKPNHKKFKTIALVGKGVCFDTGGVDLKVGNDKLFQMKSDKTGATTVITLIKYIIESNINVNIIGVIPLIENAISGSGINPGDIIKSYSGKTVEILNTDAEGRIILADAFGYLEKIKNIDYLFDMATLTGSSSLFHCHTSAVVYTTNNDIKKKIEELSESVGERIFVLPQWDEYIEYTKSNIADVKNLYYDECEKSGTFMATMFLSNFVPKYLLKKWIHLDITNSYTNHYSNGNSTILLMNLIKELVGPNTTRSSK